MSNVKVQPLGEWIVNPLKKAISVLTWAIASSGPQVFLGAPWVRASLKMAPRRWKRRLALEFLAMSPHYFYRNESNQSLSRREFLESEWLRNVASRQILIDCLVQEHVGPDSIILDYGCGPGFLAAAASKYAKNVIACDISDGVLACASILNQAPNIRYVQVNPQGTIDLPPESIDVVYSFAVIQHIDDAVFAAVLAELHRLAKVDAVVVCHIVLQGAANWKLEAEWKSDKSLKGRAKLLLGLNCFARFAEDATRLITSAGFSAPDISKVSCQGMQDDIEGQHLFLFRKLRPV